jgi:hypothetical protein
MAKIRNINGTSQADCKCGSWLKHWENFSRRKAIYCAEMSCLNKDVVGAHVQKVSFSDRNWYIVPLCSVHNNSKSDLETGDSFKLVSANVSETCGKLIE